MSELHQTSGNAWRCEAVTDEQVWRKDKDCLVVDMLHANLDVDDKTGQIVEFICTTDLTLSSTWWRIQNMVIQTTCNGI